MSATPSAAFDVWRHRFAVLTAACTLALIFIGGLVTSTGSGLAVPDWPLSYGMLMPPMVGGVFFEHGHRMAATFVGMLTTVLAVWTARRETRAGVRRLAWAALLAVIAQGLLGGLTVKFLLPAPVSVAHACLAQTFFCIVIALATPPRRAWPRRPSRRNAAMKDTRASAPRSTAS
jgi:cytochrome c oxidase assembly protein subunit 15